MRPGLRPLLILGACLWRAPVAAAVEISPLYGVQMLGGQYFFAGEKGSLSGNVSGMVAPAVKINEQWALLPALNSSYQGTKQVVDLVGAGTLFQEQMDHRAGLKAVYAPQDSLWRIKPSGSFKYELLKETKDEKWGNGLFDYQKWDLGLESEYIYKDPFSVRAGFDYYQVAFTNYTTLESQAAQNFSGLSRELVGDRILDTKNYALFLGMDAALGRLVVEGNAAATYRKFPKQHIVDGTGNLTSPFREDFVTTFGGAARLPSDIRGGLRLLSSWEVGYSYNSSNQNSFDAQRTQYLPYYYNYGEFRVGPSFKLLIGSAKEPVVFGLAGNWWYRRYPYRPIQDSAGAYQSAATHTSNWMGSASLNYPMAPHFSLIFNFQYGRALSNQNFEQSYKYNYTATNYLFGFGYSY